MPAASATAEFEHEIVPIFTPEPPATPAHCMIHSASTPPLNTAALKSPYAISRPVSLQSFTIGHSFEPLSTLAIAPSANAPPIPTRSASINLTSLKL